MKRRIIPLSEITADDKPYTGGKSLALSRLIQAGVPVPPGLAVTTLIYQDFLRITGLKDQIYMEISRKDLTDMRWEEVWDLSLRIRNLFLKTPLPQELYLELKDPLEQAFQGRATVVRSSAPSEDSASSSFAGLHESFVNVRETADIIEKIKLVWASLWSDGALLYRKELGLDISTSTMGVLVQEIVPGERSGVFFTKDPDGRDRSVLESVWGLNQGLVDGTVEPDRWFLSRKDGAVISHQEPSSRDIMITPSGKGTDTSRVPPEKASTPPLGKEDISRVRELAMKAEKIFEFPQDVEWTWKDDYPQLVQSRPITTIATSENGPAYLQEDKRSWYLSLKRSFGDLNRLRQRIEEELLPAMDQDFEELARKDLSRLEDLVLVEELEKRKSLLEKWKGIYWEEFIPFAHGARLFGQFYNDTLSPEDPYEFVDLLRNTDMESVRRNRKIEELASMIRIDPVLKEQILADKKGPGQFESALSELLSEEPLGMQWVTPEEERKRLISILLQWAELPPKDVGEIQDRNRELRRSFLENFSTGEERTFAEQMLDLARASWKLRDDDNLHLGRIERELARAIEEGRERLSHIFRENTDHFDVDQVTLCLSDSTHMPDLEALREKTRKGTQEDQVIETRARQVKGHPANAGLASGKAKVIRKNSDLFSFQKGEVLVCDAIDPNMTFIVPLASAVVERRGGMLIHGAIIAREYGLPCVTGVTDATEAIPDGASVTVDGYLGIVIIGQ